MTSRISQVENKETLVAYDTLWFHSSINVIEISVGQLLTLLSNHKKQKNDTYIVDFYRKILWNQESA